MLSIAVVGAMDLYFHCLHYQLALCNELGIRNAEPVSPMLSMKREIEKETGIEYWHLGMRLEMVLSKLRSRKLSTYGRGEYQ